MWPVSEKEFAAMRHLMVEKQLKNRGIEHEGTLMAFRGVPRHFFVTGKNVFSAYDDHPLPLIMGQTISQPYIVALMTRDLASSVSIPGPILEIGTGSGYQAAILAYMGYDVFSIERLPELAKLARSNLDKIPCGSRVRIVAGDGTQGLPAEAPFAGIIVTAASPGIPEALLEQLDSPGAIVIPCGDLLTQQMLVLKKNIKGEFRIEEGISCRFVPLLGKCGFNPF
jgi:protein-L-isoaspartate(D-aspartate) O-methyltransferase